jgi:cell division protein FtsB
MRFFTILNSFLLVLIIFGILGVFKNLIGLGKTQNRLFEAEDQVQNLENKRGELYFDAENKKSLEYIEKQIRNNLNMVNRGESLVVLPRELSEKSEEDIYKYGIVEEEKVEKYQNYREWLQILLIF